MFFSISARFVIHRASVETECLFSLVLLYFFFLKCNNIEKTGVFCHKLLYIYSIVRNRRTPPNKRTLLYFSKKIFTIAKHLKNALTYYVTGIREQSQKKSEINKQSTPLIPQNRVLLPHSCQVENYAKTRLKASRVNF